MRLPLLYLLMALSVNGFAQKFTEVSFKTYEVNRSISVDSSMIALLQPYKDSVSHYMNTVIGFSNTALYKKQPECALGNFMADCLKQSAAKFFNVSVDAAIVNYGSLHSHLPKGEVTIGSVYELMPYNNLVVVLKVNGNVLHQLLDRSAYEGGWPCSGITMTIKDKEALDIAVNGSPLSDTTVYTLAVTDYLASGGDGCSMLKNLPRQNKNYVYRDALIEYVKRFTAAGKPISATLENRVNYVGE